MHLHSTTSADDVVLAAGFGDEHVNLQDVAPVRHGEDNVHPGTDPLKSFSGADGPREDDFARGDTVLGVTSKEVTDVIELVGDTDAAGEEEDSAV